MPGVYEKQCRGPRYDYMVSTVEKYRTLIKQKDFKNAYSHISELLLSLCNDRELIEEFFYSGAFECCCEYLNIKGTDDMDVKTENVFCDKEIEMPSLIIEQFSLLSSFTLQSFDEEMGEISLLIFFLSERHRYYVDVNWKSHELEYMSIFLRSHFQFLYSAMKSYNRYQKSEGPSLLLMTLKNIEVAIRSFPAHRIIPNMIKVLIEDSTWEIISLVAETIISNTMELILEQRDAENESSSYVLMQFRDCTIVLIQIITYIPLIGTTPGINKYVMPSLIQIGLQKLFLTENNGMVSVRCSCKYCENYRKVQKICTKKEELLIKETVPLLQNLIGSFMNNNSLDILGNLFACIKNIENNCEFVQKEINNNYAHEKTYTLMIPFLHKILDFEDLNKVVVNLMQIIPKLTKVNCEQTHLTTFDSKKLCFTNLRLSRSKNNDLVPNLDNHDRNNEEIKIVILSDHAKAIISCLSAIVLHRFEFPIKDIDSKQLSGILEIICPTFELLLRRCIAEWDKYSEFLMNIQYSRNEIIQILSEINTILVLVIPIYLKQLCNRYNSYSKSIQKSTFRFVQKSLSAIMIVFSELFQNFCRMIITENNQNSSSSDKSKNKIDQEIKDIIYNIGASLISCLSIISDISTYSWTCVSRRRYLASPHYKICGWISSTQYKFVDYWTQIFLSDRCIYVKELSQIITLISERSSALNSKRTVIDKHSKDIQEFVDQCETYIEETEDERYEYSNENNNFNSID